MKIEGRTETKKNQVRRLIQTNKPIRHNGKAGQGHDRQISNTKHTKH